MFWEPNMTYPNQHKFKKIYLEWRNNTLIVVFIFLIENIINIS